MARAPLIDARRMLPPPLEVLGGARSQYPQTSGI
jgi:hypothetical protein